MSKKQKIQLLFTLAMIPFIVIACIFGAKFLTDTIYLFLVQESVAADANLMKLLLGYISTYHLLHVMFVVAALVCIGISAYVFYKDRSYKIGIFTTIMSVAILVLVFMNKGLINLMDKAKGIIAVTTDISPFFELGKDFISVTSKVSGTLPAAATSIALKSIIFDIVILSIFLLVGIVLILRVIDLRRYEKE